VCEQLLKSFCLPLYINYSTEAILPGKSVTNMFDNLILIELFLIIGYSNADEVKFIRTAVDLATSKTIVAQRTYEILFFTLFLVKLIC
jgi:hypothetical protein